VWGAASCDGYCLFITTASKAGPGMGWREYERWVKFMRILSVECWHQRESLTHAWDVRIGISITGLNALSRVEYRFNTFS